MADYWFKAKTYGTGWTPSTWQGWLVIVVYIALLAAGAAALVPVNVGHALPILAFMFYVAATTGLLVWIAHKKGPPLEWRWGAKK